jgi:hypothetical protein
LRREPRRSAHGNRVAAVSALAVGALAIGALAVGRLQIRKARLGKVEIDDLTVRRFRVVEETDGDSAANEFHR